MASVNKTILIGHLGKDPELRFAANNKPVTGFSLATNEAWTGKNGNKEEKTEWHRIIVWGRMAEICNEYLSKGSQVYVEGRLQTRKWEKDGEDRYTTEIVAHTVQFLNNRGERKSSAQSQNQGQAYQSIYDEPKPSADVDDDIPF